jgi:hypothetical protein
VEIKAAFERAANQSFFITRHMSDAAKVTVGAGKTDNAPYELLGEKPYEPLDARASGATGRADPAMAALGKSHRAEDGQG